MHLNTLTVSAFVAAVAAYPSVVAPRALSSKTETNAGIFPNKDFDAKTQFVDVRKGSGHEFIAPRESDIRGPCPGLNAAANHGFTSRTGINNYEDTTEGLFKALSIGKDFTNILFVFSMFNSGSFIDEKWSIGGPMKTTTIHGLVGQGLGLSNSHNKYEGDASTGRGDAYLHNGDAHSLVLGNFENILLHASEGGKDDFDFVAMRKHLSYSHEYTIKHNPYGFFGPGFFVSPIAHEFVTAMMSNHSESDIGGTLPKHVLKSFFSVKTHKDGSLEWIKGHDQIPQNWYKRPENNPYGIAASFGDLALSIKENPAIADIGGNMGKPNSYAGIEIEDLTSGVFKGPTILEGNNLACFAVQGLVIGTPGFASALLNKATPFIQKANKILGNHLNALGCPELAGDKYKAHKFEKYPGFVYQQPIQPATPY